MATFEGMRFCAAFPVVTTFYDAEYDTNGLQSITVTGERFGGDDLWREVKHQFVFDTTELKAVAFSDWQRLNYLNPNQGSSYVMGDINVLDPKFQYTDQKPDLDSTIFMYNGSEIVKAGIHDHMGNDFKNRCKALMIKIMNTGRIPTAEELSKA